MTGKAEFIASRSQPTANFSLGKQNMATNQVHFQVDPINHERLLMLMYALGLKQNAAVKKILTDYLYEHDEEIRKRFQTAAGGEDKARALLANLMQGSEEE